MMLHSKIILNAVFTIAFLTRNSVVQTKIIQVASLGVKSALVNTNHIYAVCLSIQTAVQSAIAKLTFFCHISCTLS